MSILKMEIMGDFPTLGNFSLSRALYLRKSFVLDSPEQ